MTDFLQFIILNNNRPYITPMQTIEFSNHIWHALIIQAPDAIIVINGEQNIIFFNPAAEKMFGWKKGEILGRPLNLLLPERYRQKHNDQVVRYRDTGLSQRDNTKPMEFTGIRKNGEEFAAEVTIAKTEVCGKLYFSAIIRELTEKKEILKQLTQSQTRLALALEAGELGYWDINLATKEIYRDDKAAQLLQCKAGLHKLGKDGGFRAIHPKDKPKVSRLLNATIKSQTESFFAEFRVFDEAEKEYRWVEGQGKITERNEEGVPLRFTGIIRSIKEKKEKEALQQMYETALLEAFVGGETRERQRLAQELHDGLGQHIQIVLFSFEKLKRKCKSADESVLAEMNQISKQLCEIALEVRSLAHDLAGFTIEGSSLRGSIERLFEKLSYQDKIQFHLDWKAGDITLNKEYAHNIYRIMQEIINNTLRHSEAESCWVAVETLNNQLSLYFVDNGKGFETEGEKWKQGLGFSSLQTRVNFLKGQMKVASEPRKGCQITIAIPLTAQEKDDKKKI
jgi:PAS domain S-box-containing protein